MTQPTALAALARTALDAASRAGLDVDAVLERSRVPREVIDALDGRIAVADLLRLWEIAAEMSGDPFFGLHAGEHVVSARTIHVVGFAARNSRSVAECYEHTVRFAALTNESSEIAVVRERTRASVVVGPKAGLPMWPRVYAEMAIAAYLCIGRKWSGVDIAPLHVTFQHAEPADISEYTRLFGPRVRFGAPQNRLTLSNESLELPFGTTDPEMLAYFQTMATSLLGDSSSPASLEHQVRAAIARTMADHPPTLARIARHLAMSPRTLQRRLADSSLSFTLLVDDVRRITALRLLSARDAMLDAVALRVGYRDPDAFRAAVQRWTGKNPRALRREST
jgi:AraC-like DNA-binding protein